MTTDEEKKLKIKWAIIGGIVGVLFGLIGLTVLAIAMMLCKK